MHKCLIKYSYHMFTLISYEQTLILMSCVLLPGLNLVIVIIKLFHIW